MQKVQENGQCGRNIIHYFHDLASFYLGYQGEIIDISILQSFKSFFCSDNISESVFIIIYIIFKIASFFRNKMSLYKCFPFIIYNTASFLWEERVVLNFQTIRNHIVFSICKNHFP